MKKKVLILVLTVLSVFPVAAQNRWGVTGGLGWSFSCADNADFDGARPGFYLGGLYDVKLSEQWYFQPQLLFTPVRFARVGRCICQLQAVWRDERCKRGV